MTTFFEVRNPTGEQVWIAAREDKRERRIFVWLANSGHWVWNDAVQADFYAFDPDLEYVEITHEEATRQLATWPPLSPGWVLDDLLAVNTAAFEQLDRSESELSHRRGRSKRMFHQPDARNAIAGFKEQTAAEELARSTMPMVVMKLREVLGARLVAYIGNARSTRLVSEWASGDRLPVKNIADRLRNVIPTRLHRS